VYAVVGCGECSTLWLLADPRSQESAVCPGCGRRHRTEALRRLFESDDREAAREARAAMLAERDGHAEAFENVESVAAMEDRVEEAGVDDREYLEAAGIDADAVADAGERDRTSQSRDEVVREALRTLDRPTEDEVVDYASERGVDADFAREFLDRLVRRGEATGGRGGYRLL